MIVDDEITPLDSAARSVAASLQSTQLAPIWVSLILMGIDLVLVGLFMWFVKFSVSQHAFNAISATLFSSVAAIAFVSVSLVLNAYTPRAIASLGASIVRAVGVFGLVSAVSFWPLMAGQQFVALVVALMSVLLILCVQRLLLSQAMSWAMKAGLLHRRAVIAGGGEQAANLIKELHQQTDNNIRLFGLFDDRDDQRSPIQTQGVPKLGGFDALLTFVQQTEIDMVIVALPFSAHERIDWLLDKFRVLPVEVRLADYNEGYSFPQKSTMKVLMERHFTPQRRLRKRAFDMCFALLALLLVWPIMVLCALVIRLESSGPILFRQTRHGFNNRPVEVLKFRTMYREHSDPEARDLVKKGDPRVTRVGRFLRRTSLDELPQLINVLRGELSLVGPRPHVLNAVSSQQLRFSSIVDGYAARHRLPPGITGWAQINGWRGEVDQPDKLRNRFEHDLYYIENWSLWLDLKILLATPRSLLRGEGAY